MDEQERSHYEIMEELSSELNDIRMFYSEGLITKDEASNKMIYNTIQSLNEIGLIQV